MLNGARLAAIASSGALALAASAPCLASADTFTVGSLNLPAGATNSICGGNQCTVVQGRVDAASVGSYTLRVPADGTITSWSFRSASFSASNSYSLRVLRPANAQETSFTAKGTADSPLVPDANDAVRGPFPVSIPVKAGDRLGLRGNGPGDFGVPVFTSGQSGDGVRYFIAPDIADGSTATPSNPGDNGQQVLVQVTVQTGPPPPFVPPPPPPPPDFRIVRNPPAKFAFLMRRHDKLAIPLIVQRLYGSRGPIALRVKGAPKGTKVTLSHTTVDSTLDTPIVVTIAPPAGGAARPGSYKMNVIGTPTGGAATGPATRSLTVPVNVLGELNARVEGVEVTQSVQTFEQPYGGAYYGVPLVKGKKTVARVFADFEGVAAKIKGKPTRPELGMALYGYDSSGHQLPLSPILPDWSPSPGRLSINDDGLTLEERVGADTAYTFDLPGTWTKRGRIKLVAQALGSAVNVSGSELCVEESCGAVPQFHLPGIDFGRAPAARRINALAALPWNADTGKFDVGAPPIRPFAQLQAMVPVPLLFLNRDNVASPIPRYRDERAVSDKAIWEGTRDYDNDIGRPGDFTIGAFVPLAGKFGGGIAPGPRTAVGEATGSRVVAHEALHLFGFRHADSVCGGGGGGFPDPQGRSRSVGLDTTEGSGGGPGSPPYRVIADTAASPTWDLMSYCGGDWISELNWRRMLDPSAPRATPGRRADRAAHVAQAGPTLTVRARVLSAGAEIVEVGRSTGPVPAPTPLAGFTLVARDAAGRVLTSTPMAATSTHSEMPGGATTFLDGLISAADVARVEVTSGGQVIAARDRSADAPDARLISPRTGARLRGGAVSVTWQTADSDSGERQIALDYSANGGRTFTPVLTGPDTGRARLAVNLLAASNNARLRLRVNDGFNDTETTSGRLKVAARPPSVTILAPTSRATLSAGSVVNLAGAAQDDHGRALRGRALRWFAGRRALGRGEQVTTTLPAGTRTLRLVAVDRSGRRSSRTLRTRVRATTPFFLRLKAPARLSRSARAVTLGVAATQPSTLRVRGRRFRIGRGLRRIHVAVPRGRGTLHLGLVLSAGGRRSLHAVTIARR